jgi:hypothetical protein
VAVKGLNEGRESLSTTLYGRIMSVHQQDRSISKSTALGCKIDQLLPQLHKEINNLHTDVFEENARLYEEVNRKDDEIKQLKVKLAEVTTSQQEYKEVCMKLRMELIDMRLQIRSCQHSQLQQIAETLKSFRNEDRMSSISESEALSIGQKTHQTSMSVFDDPIQGDATVDVVEEDPVINEKMDEENQMGIQHGEFFFIRVLSSFQNFH